MTGADESLIRREFSSVKGNLEEKSLKILAKHNVCIIGSEAYVKENFCLRYACQHGTLKEILYFFNLSEFVPFNVQDLFETKSKEEIKIIFDAFMKRHKGKYDIGRLAEDICTSAFEFDLRGYKNDLWKKCPHSDIFLKPRVEEYVESRRTGKYIIPHTGRSHHEFDINNGKLMYLLATPIIQKIQNFLSEIIHIDGEIG